MDQRFKTSNIIALLIAVALIASGFALGVVHRKSESAKQQTPATHRSTTKTGAAAEGILSSKGGSPLFTTGPLVPRSTNAMFNSTV